MVSASAVCLEKIKHKIYIIKCRGPHPSPLLQSYGEEKYMYFMWWMLHLSRAPFYTVSANMNSMGGLSGNGTHNPGDDNETLQSNSVCSSVCVRHVYPPRR